MFQLKAHKRRDALKSLIKLGLFLPFASQFTPSRTLAGASNRSLRRLITVYYPNGAQLDQWHPKASGPLRKAQELSFSLDPLKDYGHQLILFRGLSSKGHGGSPSHPEAASRILSGGEMHKESFDVAIGNRLRRGTSLGYIHSGLFTRYNRGKDYLLFRDKNGQSILPEDDPKRLGDQLFGSSRETGQRERDMKVLEILQNDLTYLKKHDHNKEVAKKLAIHQSSLDYMESLLNSNALKKTTCGPRQRPAMGSDRRANNIIAEDLTMAQFDNIVDAFKCDLCQVASFQFMSAQDESLYINFDSLRAHLDRADGGGFGSEKKWWNQNTSHASSHEGNEVFRVQNRWYNMMVAKLCEKLDQTADPQGGGTLLDTSVILVFSENGESTIHGMEDLPWYLVGGGAGGLATGQILNLSARGTSDLFLEIGRLMGMPWSRYGASSIGVPELYSQA